MTENLDEKGLSSIVDKYDFYFIDLWGVIHNGIVLHSKAIDVLKKISEIKKDYILLTNAPRPNNIVKSFLEKMGMSKSIRDRVYTSGEAALKYLKKNHQNENFFHVGPPRDFDLFFNFKNKKTQNLNQSKYILCTGLFTDHEKDLNYYKDLLIDSISQKMICTNPDLIVDRGKRREYCAGSVAKVFEDLGGEVVYFGKPHPEVYNQSIDNNDKKILAIGDNLNTDIRGANQLNYDCLLISNGIHKDEINNKGIEKVAKEYEVLVNFIQSDLKW